MGSMKPRQNDRGTEAERRRKGSAGRIGSRDCADLTEHLLLAIESARTTLWVASPFIDDDRIVQALISAKARRVRIKVITDIRNNRGRGKQYVTRGFEAKPEEAKNVDAHQACIRKLARSRISCRSPTHYPHFKLIVADDRIAYFSSANLTKNSLGGNAKSSLEAGLTLIRQEQVEHILQLLSQLWSSCPFRLILNERDVSIEQHGSGEHNRTIE
jgi:phosphatidylserine/phosphatidylglycerophosphate/cardiolipin synthase-like enzyme